MYEGILTDDELRQLDAKRIHAYELPKEKEYLGYLMLPYGDEMYYRLPDGQVVTVYSSIGD